MNRFTLILAALVIAAPAFAAEAARAPAIIPYGDLLRDAMLAFGASASVLIAWGLRALPKHIQFLIVQMRIDRMLTAAITSAINRTAGAQAGKALSLDLGNAVANRAVEYVAGRAAELIKDVGGIQRLREMILARLYLDEAAAIEAPAPAPALK